MIGLEASGYILMLEYDSLATVRKLIHMDSKFSSNTPIHLLYQGPQFAFLMKKAYHSYQETEVEVTILVKVYIYTVQAYMTVSSLRVSRAAYH